MEPELTRNDRKLLKRLNKLSFRAEKHMMRTVWGKLRVSKYGDDNYYPIGMFDLQNGKLSNHALNKFKDLNFIKVMIGSPKFDNNTGLYDYFTENILIIPTATSRDYLARIREENQSQFYKSVFFPILVSVLVNAPNWISPIQGWLVNLVRGFHA